MIITVTPNPSVDRTVAVGSLTVGGVNRATSVRVDPGGKGVNVARALCAHGTATTAVVPLGGADGHLLGELLHEAGVGFAPVALAASTRSNISIVDPSGITTKINEPGPELSAAECAHLYGVVEDLLDQHPSWLVVSGSLPIGLDESFYAHLIASARARGVLVAADTTEAALSASALAGADLLKPNDEELAFVTGTTLETIGDVVTAAEKLRPPHGQVVVSLGALGALLVDGNGACMAHAVCEQPLSTVGAGDSLLAGYLHAGTRDASALATGVAWGTAAVGLPGSQMPGPADVAGIGVTVFDPPFDRPLHP